MNPQTATGTPAHNGTTTVPSTRKRVHNRFNLTPGARKLLLDAALLTALAFVLRMASFGHPNIHDDETFYLLVGQAMHHGALPYVDIWDRKPLGLFILFYLFAGISDSVVVYQVAATLFAAATATAIKAIAERWAGRQGGLLAGASYLLMLPLFIGFGGQAPVFYNLPVTVGVWLVLTAIPALRQARVPRRVFAAMALCGIAITVKQTTLFESAFLGLAVIVYLARAGLPASRVIRVAALCALLGALPTLLISGYYWGAGHWSEYWHAMVTSNLAKAKPTGVTVAARSIGAFLRLEILLCLALLAVVVPVRQGKRFPEQRFVLFWLGAATVGFLAVPNFYPHYVLPLLVPLCVVASGFLGRRWLGLAGFAGLAGLSVGHWYDPFNFAFTRSAERSVGSMAQSIRDHSGGRGLLVFDGPPILYSLTGQRPMTPLAFPLHLNYAAEQDVSHLRTADELRRVLALRPGAVTMTSLPRNNPANRETSRLVLNYVEQHCRLVDLQMSNELFRNDMILIYGDCR